MSPAGYDEGFWDTMGYREWRPEGPAVRVRFPVEAPECPITVTPPSDPPLPILGGEGGATLPWADSRVDPPGVHPIEQVTTEQGRYYMQPMFSDDDRSTLRRFPSITTVLNYMEDGAALEAWRRRVGEEEAERVRATAARIGDAVHQYASEYCLTGDCGTDLRDGKEADSVRAHTNRIRRAVSAHMEEFYASEMRLISHTLGAAGTVDLVCKWRMRGEEEGKLAIVDFKTKSKPMHPNALDRYYLQAGFYAYCWKEHFGHTPNRLVIVESVADSANATIHADTLFPHRIRPLSGEVDSFMRALARAKEECQKW